MPRMLRVEYEDAVYHVMNQGGRRDAIFHNDEDRELFLATLGQTCRNTEWQVQAWCLMPNHFHLGVDSAPAGDGALANGRQRRAAAADGNIIQYAISHL